MNILNKKIASFSRPAFGLDISDLSIRLVQFDAENKTELVRSYADVDLPPGCMVDGEILKKEGVVSGIRRALEKSSPHKLSSKQVVCAVPETKAFLRILAMPPMEQVELGEALKWEIEANIPMALDQVYYDWQILDQTLGKEPKKMSVLVVAVARNVVDQLIEVVQASGFTVVGLETESIAQSRSLINQDEKEKHKTTLIIDFGSKRTSFLISVGTTPCFTSSVPISIQTLVGAYSKAFGIDLAEAEKVRATYGIGSTVAQDSVFRVAKPIVQGMVSEIRRSMDFYLSDLNYSNGIETVLLCGEGSMMHGVLPYFSKELSMPVQIGNPWVNVLLGHEIPIIDKVESSRFSTAIGLALRGVRDFQ